MEYKGKLYGHLGGKMYFDTGKTADDWDALEKRVSELKATIKNMEFGMQHLAAENERLEKEMLKRKDRKQLNGMITTLDNYKIKRYDKVWEIGVTINGIYVPTLSIYGSAENPLGNEERCWKSYALCLAECDRKNSLDKNNQ